MIDRDEQIQQFMNENCVLCGTQSCVCHLDVVDEEAISHCGRYHGEIPGIPKIKSVMEVLEEWEDFVDRDDRKGINNTFEFVNKTLYEIKNNK